jgi:ATPase family AAA domain-containing protein 2
MISIKSELRGVRFIIPLTYSITELVPSSARSSTSSASPLPSQFVPLLSDVLERMKELINKVLPLEKKRTALEEAEWEDDTGDGALDREIMMQCQSLTTLLGQARIAHSLY